MQWWLKREGLKITENKIHFAQLFSVPSFSISAQLHAYCFCRLIWNKYRKYKMRTYINTLHQTFRYAYTPKMIFVTKLRKTIS